MKQPKNLKYLCCALTSKLFNPTFLLGLVQLKEIFLDDHTDLLKPFEPKQLYGRDNLKVYRYGCLLFGPKDPAIKSDIGPKHWRLAKIRNEDQECCPTMVNILSRLTDLQKNPTR